MSATVFLADIDFARGIVLSPPKLAPGRMPGRTAYAAWPPDGKLLAFNETRGAAIAVHSIGTNETREVRLAGFRGFTHPQWHGGSAWLVGFGERDGRLRLSRAGANRRVSPAGDRRSSADRLRRSVVARRKTWHNRFGDMRRGLW